MGNVFGSFSPWTVPLAALGLLFQAWPFVMLAVLQQRRMTIGSLIGIWVALAIVRIAILFDEHPLWDTLVWSDPLRTSAFLFVGVILSTVVIIPRVHRR